MTNKEFLESVVAEILQLVAHVEEGGTDFTGKKWGADTYWGDDTECGTVEEIHAAALKILEEKLGISACPGCDGLIASIDGPIGTASVCTCNNVERKIIEVEPDNFEKFLVYHKLKLKIVESVGKEQPSFQASLYLGKNSAEIAERGMLTGVRGWGKTEQEAIEHLKREIAGKNLAFGSWGENPGTRFWAPSVWK